MRVVKHNGRGGPRPGAGRPANPTRVVRLPLPIADLVHGLANGRFRPGMIAEVMSVEARTPAAVPLMTSRAACGFPSPADDYTEQALDFNELLIANPAATFTVRVEGESMIGAGIFPGDLAIIDRSLTPTNGCIVLACVDGEFTMKRYKKTRGQVVLEAENPTFKAILLTEENAFEVWGVVTDSIRRHRP